ncbi:MAG: arginyltransferase [Gemmataceae bacterium]
MQARFHYVAPPSPCGYLPEQLWSLEYLYVDRLSAAEYLQKMLEGWRRFGYMLFRPACASCQACQAIRIVVDAFRPDRSQRRCAQLNQGDITLRIGPPTVDQMRLDLYDRYHAFQAESKGWPDHPPKDAESYLTSFVHQPFPVEEWCFYLGDVLVGVGYVDPVPEANLVGKGHEGLSAIYFIYDPAYRERGLGTWNVLSLIAEARRRELPYVYLGYYVEGSSSMAYKPRFVPNEVRREDGTWELFRP